MENDIGIIRNSEAQRRSLKMGEKDSKCSVDDAEISIHRITRRNCRSWESYGTKRI